jgi:hypothetical protein
MFLFDAVTVPLVPGRYRWTARTDVEVDGYETAADPLSRERFFEVDAPRFALGPKEVAGVFPPRNARGAFHAAVPHVVLGRRTLPWERTLGAPLVAPPPPPAGDPGPPVGPVPWLALLLFEESECTVLPALPLEQVVPAGAAARLGAPAGVQCDAVEASLATIRQLMPSREELQLLTHVRWVNVDDRELSAGDSDGWFAVVMSNRLPEPGHAYRACLVSVEERTDLVPEVAPPVAEGLATVFVEPQRPRRGVAASLLAAAPDRAVLAPAFPTPSTARLVLLHHWRFECAGGGTFRQLVQALDVAMFGTVRAADGPQVADTGHLPLELHDRVGGTQTVWYRGPLAAHPLSRDTLGPYHAADQARRVSPESGAEDVSYAAAFEVGRLLAAADGRLAQELLRWRRACYRRGATIDLRGALGALAASAALPEELLRRLPGVLSLAVAAGVLDRVARRAGPSVDPAGLRDLSQVVGLDPASLAVAWRLESVDVARAVLQGDPAALGAVVTPVAPSPRPDVTLDEVAADRAAGAVLAAARARVLRNAGDAGEGEGTR